MEYYSEHFIRTTIRRQVALGVNCCPTDSRIYDTQAGSSTDILSPHRGLPLLAVVAARRSAAAVTTPKADPAANASVR